MIVSTSAKSTVRKGSQSHSSRFATIQARIRLIAMAMEYPTCLAVSVTDPSVNTAPLRMMIHILPDSLSPE